MFMVFYGLVENVKMKAPTESLNRNNFNKNFTDF